MLTFFIQRLVKIFAQNEQGIDVPVCAYPFHFIPSFFHPYYLPIPCFSLSSTFSFIFEKYRYIQPMRAGRLLDSPRHAARFVSLLPFEKDESLGGGKYSSLLPLSVYPSPLPAPSSPSPPLFFFFILNKLILIAGRTYGTVCTLSYARGRVSTLIPSLSSSPLSFVSFSSFVSPFPSLFVSFSLSLIFILFFLFQEG